VKVSLRYLHNYRDRHGKVRVYFRRNGLLRPLDPHAPDFAGAYQQALSDSEKPASVPSALACPKGSFGALSHAYESSAMFKQLAPATRREMGYMLKRLTKAHAGQRVDDLGARDVLGWQDELADRPGTANNMLRVMKRLMSFAVERGYRASNPLQGLRELKGGKHRAWTDEEHEAFKARWPLGTMQRRAYALALYTGQRKGDLIAMQTRQRAGGYITLTQRKTAEPLAIPEHPELTRELEAMKPPGFMMLWKSGGGQISEGHFGSMMRDAIRAALDVCDEDGEVITRTACVFHGLRSSASKRLADAGCTAHQIAAVTGHKTLRMVQEYTRQADQKKLATAAVHKLASSEKG
jgi:integrase